MTQYLTRALWAFLLALCAWSASANRIEAQPEQPPLNYDYYVRAINALAGNRASYNTLNDSIFVKQTKDEWIQNFRHRSDIFAQIYNNDRKIIDAIKYDVDHYALADSVYYRNDATYGQLHSLKSMYILNLMTGFMLRNQDDPFLVQEIAKPICDLILRKMPESEISIIAAHLMADCYMQILRFTKEPEVEQQFVRYCEAGIAFDYRIPTFKSVPTKSYLKGCYVRLFTHKSKNSGEVLIRNYNRLKALCNSAPMKEYFLNEPAEKKSYETILTTSAYTILRNYYMTYEWDTHTAFTDSVARIDLKRNSTYTQLTKRTAIAKGALTKVYLGIQTFDEAFAEANAFYADSLAPKSPINVSRMSLYTNPLLNLIFLLDNTTLPYREKHAQMLKYVDALVQTARMCKDNQSNNIRNAVVTRLLSYERLLKYLTSQEKENFFHSLMAYTQVQTYAHSQQVADLCVVVTGAVIDRDPSLLVGMLGTHSAADVKKNRQRILKFIANAALYHDLGKLSMAELVKNDYRPLTDYEFSIIKEHPERGAKYLECDPALMQYHDFAIGHHKWYDGKGGYPAGYDNTRSPYRTLVDVLTICDCLDAATDRVGRNYALKKSYATLEAEFKAQSGTRYNPHIVKIITTDNKVREQLSQIVESGWLNNYYDIYKEYFSE